MMQQLLPSSSWYSIQKFSISEALTTMQIHITPLVKKWWASIIPIASSVYENTSFRLWSKVKGNHSTWGCNNKWFTSLVFLLWWLLLPILYSKLHLLWGFDHNANSYHSISQKVMNIIHSNHHFYIFREQDLQAGVMNCLPRLTIRCIGWLLCLQDCPTQNHYFSSCILLSSQDDALHLHMCWEQDCQAGAMHCLPRLTIRCKGSLLCLQDCPAQIHNF